MAQLTALPSLTFLDVRGTGIPRVRILLVQARAAAVHGRVCASRQHVDTFDVAFRSSFAGHYCMLPSCCCKRALCQ